MRTGRLLAALTVSLLILSSSQIAHASGDFQAKWPWQPIASVGITTLPKQGVHGCQPGGECVAAYDLVINNNAVVNGTEGTVTARDDTFLPNDCGSLKHLGNFVQAGGWKYGHLDSLAASVGFGVLLLQGDAVGVQGATGNVDPCCDVRDPQCQIGKHLHWELAGAAAVPAAIDGTATSTVTLSSHPASTNSIIGEYSISGASLRTGYGAHGGWAAVGWTSNLGGGLSMFANRSWGRIQDFQHDPDGFGGTANTLGVANWDTSNAHLIDSVFWLAWALGAPDHNGFVRPLSMTLQERGSCPAGSSAACISFQRFHLGYVWMDSFTGRTAVFCPDVTNDQNVDFADVLYVNGFFGRADVPFADTDGSGGVTLTDTLIELGEFGKNCRP